MGLNANIADTRNDVPSLSQRRSLFGETRFRLRRAEQLLRLKDFPDKHVKLAKEFAVRPMTVQQLKKKVDAIPALQRGLGWEAVEVDVVPRIYKVLIRRDGEKRWVQIIRRFEKTPRDIVCPTSGSLSGLEAAASGPSAHGAIYREPSGET